jgi:LCP family protein required for cell wall assembly
VRGRQRRRGRRTWGQRLLLVVSGLVCVGLVGTAAGLAYVYSKYSQLSRVELGVVLTDQEASNQPQNFLLVGVDSAANLDADDPARAGRGAVGGLRSDTVMVLRLDPDSDRASLLSLPRDLWVPLAGGGRSRINSAIERGGPAELIDTVEGYFGIPIHHYVQVDFAGFQELVDVVDGVEVYFANPSRDRRSLLDVPEAGCITLDGQQALAYVRSRHFQTLQDGRWRSDPSADLGRISRQQDFIVRALRRAVDRGVRNPVTLDRLVNAGLATVTVDDLLTADDIIGLGQAFRGFDPDSLDLYTLPVEAGTVGGAAILRLNDAEVQPTLDIFRGTDPDDIQPSDVRVRVLNGSGVPGEAGETGAGLTAVGFAAEGTAEADRFDYAATIVRYTAGGEAKAHLVARHLDPTPELEEVEGPLPADVVIITGHDLEGVRATARPPGPSTSAPPTTAATSGTPPSSTGSTSTTSTTVVGFVPEVPAGVGC